MKNRNCPNCGGEIEYDKSKCPYCGTSYFDISCFTVDDEPFFLKIKVGDKTYTAKVFMKNATITHPNDNVYTAWGNGYMAFPSYSIVDLDLSLTSVPFVHDGKTVQWIAD